MTKSQGRSGQSRPGRTERPRTGGRRVRREGPARFSRKPPMASGRRSERRPPGPDAARFVAPGPDPESSISIYGRHPVREALKAGRPLSRILIQEGLAPESFGDILGAAKEHRIPVSIVPKMKLDLLAESRPHQGVAALEAAAATLTEAHLEDLLAAVVGPPFVLILDGVQDPQNLGAILRVADGAGVHFVVIPERGAVGLTPVVAKVSAGATSWVPVVRVVNLSRAIDTLKAAGVFVWAAVPNGDAPYTAQDWTGPTALVLGGEGQGLRPLVSKHCDGTVFLPMHGRLASLNVATAAAVLAFEVGRQRTGREAVPHNPS